MARPPQTEIRLRLVVEAPAPGVAYSLQDQKSRPVDPRMSVAGEPLIFEFPIHLAPGPKFHGEQVRREGAYRRFVYVAVGRQAGEHGSPWSRRMKIDIHGIPATLLEQALGGRRLVGTVQGRGKDGTPACATVRVESWQALMDWKTTQVSPWGGERMERPRITISRTLNGEIEIFRTCLEANDTG